MANQNETSQVESWVAKCVFTLFSQAFKDGHFAKREILSPGLELSSGNPCDVELFLANNPRPEIRRDNENQRTKDCETNTDVRN